MISERRRKERKKLREICYIQIEPGNGGLVLDLSEHGLSFQAAAPVQQAGPICFSFSSYLKGQVDASGELVWMNPDKRSGGLRFSELTAAAQECVRELLAESAQAATKEPGSSIPSVVTANEAAAAPAAALQPDPAAAQAPPVMPMPSAVPEDERPPVQLGSAFASSLSPLLSGQSLFGAQASPEANPPFAEELKAARRQGFLHGALLGIALTALAAAAGLWILRDYQRQIIGSFQAEDTPSSSAQKPTDAGAADSQVPGAPLPAAPSEQSQTGAQTEAPAQAPSSPSPDSTSSPNAQTVHSPSPDNSAQAPAAEPSAAPGTVGQSFRGAQSDDATASPSSEAGQAELDTADKFLRGEKNDASNIPTAEQWLWAAVEKGNTQAEIELSDLYLSGDGIKRNCEQARILLLAAAEKGNRTAKEKLESVNREGCRG